MQYLIGVDDTDNAESQGTGHLSRDLAHRLSTKGLVEIEGITRHQLLVDPRIRYTSHNSSACITVNSSPDRLERLIEDCRDFLSRESAPGADAGLCVAAWPQAGESVQRFGQRAKHEVLRPDEATGVAADAGLVLEGLTGDHGGIIGALAAVGLRASNSDGRFLWLKGLRELSGIYTADQLRRLTAIESIQTRAGLNVPLSDRIDVGEWIRPLLKNGQILLLVEEVKDHGEYEWRVIAKDVVKQLSN